MIISLRFDGRSRESVEAWGSRRCDFVRHQRFQRHRAKMRVVADRPAGHNAALRSRCTSGTGRLVVSPILPVRARRRARRCRIPLEREGRPGAGAKVADFSLKDIHRRPRSLDDFKDKKAIVVVFLDTECPLVEPLCADPDRPAQGVRRQGRAVPGASTPATRTRSSASRPTPRSATCPSPCSRTSTRRSRTRSARSGRRRSSCSTPGA